MRLSDYLDLHRLKPTAFAAAADIPNSVVTRLLRGERGVSLETAVKIEIATDGAVTARECLPSSEPDASPLPEQASA